MCLRLEFGDFPIASTAYMLYLTIIQTRVVM
jgi:hypothetical protein